MKQESPMPDILDDLMDLHKQATTERSHYYVAGCCKRAIEEIQTLRADLEKQRMASAALEVRLVT